MARPSSTQIHTHIHAYTHARAHITHQIIWLIEGRMEINVSMPPIAFLLFPFDTSVSRSVFFFSGEQHVPAMVALQGQV